jgi:twitching motility two-component system response regulator PilH
MAKFVVVDDVELERLNMAGILRKAGHTVIEAKDGIEGVAAVKANKPDAVIMDIVMPNKDGFAATKQLMMDPETKGIPVVIVSSKAQESDKFRAQQLGAKGYLVKPATAAAVLPVIKQILG